MKTKFSITQWLTVLAVATISLQPAAGLAQGTGFTYQGRLFDAGGPANGRYDLKFNLYDAPAGGSLVAGPITNSPVTVSNGLFVVTLDFGAGLFTGPARWLEIGARSNTVAVVFTILSPRQQLTPTPYAIMANSASNLLGLLPAGQLSGTVGNGQLANSSLRVNAGTGLSGGGTVSLGGSTTLNNAGVLSVTGDADITAAPNIGGVFLSTTATDANTASRIVKRDASGNFTAGSITLAGNLNLPATTASSGAIYSGANLLLHDYGTGNFFAGLGAGNLSMSGVANLGLGSYALDANTMGNYNSALGYNALTANTNGSNNTANGYDALFFNLSGSGNTALGTWAMELNTVGNYNTAVGMDALLANTNGSYNTAVGYYAGFNNPNGNQNTALGYAAGYYPTNGSYNIHIGSWGAAADTQIIRIGMTGYETSAYMAGIYGNTVSNFLPVYVDANGELGTIATGSVVQSANQTNTGTTTFNPPSGPPFVVSSSSLVAHLNADLLDGMNSTAFWNVNGNAGTTGGVNFVGTTDNQPLELRVNNIRVLRLESSSSPIAANMIVNPTANSVATFGSSIGAGTGNQIQNNAYYSAIVAGSWNQIQSNSYNSVIGGGSYNQIQGNTSQGANGGTIGGGYGNILEPFGYQSFIGGGYGNRIQYNGDEAVIGGGYGNVTGTNADYATIPGGYLNVANGMYSLAAGRQAKANYQGDFVWADSQGVDFNSTGVNQFLIRAGGGVGIGTAAPQQFLSVQGGLNIDQANYNSGFINNGNTNGYGITFGSYSGEGIASKRTTGGNQFGLDFYTGYANHMSISQGGNVAINGNALLVRDVGDTGNGLQYTSGLPFFPTGSGPLLFGWNGGALGSVSPTMASLAWDYSGNVWISNNCSVATLTIRGGADLAEPFDITDKEVTEGAVVVIDAQNPGHLKLSDRAYDKRVAGVVSGANGVNPGIQMHQQGLIEGGRNVALTGRVYVQADASNGAIEPGDMLTTSSTPGHAMKVSDQAKAAGAILGKAMTSLSEGKGLVLVLVTLQ